MSPPLSSSVMVFSRCLSVLLAMLFLVCGDDARRLETVAAHREARFLLLFNEASLHRRIAASIASRSGLNWKLGVTT